ncbi:MAG: cyclodeaminase/cyclohydrolase family protein, partial [bacterium]
LVSSFISSLGAMVASLSQGKNFQGIREEMRGIEERLKTKSFDFLSLAQKDEQAFQEFMEALRRAKREGFSGKFLSLKAKEAIRIPLEVIEELSSLFPAFELLLKEGNKNLVSDVGIACILASAVIRASTLNVLINLPLVQEDNLREEILLKVQRAFQYALNFDGLAQTAKKCLEGGE